MKSCLTVTGLRPYYVSNIDLSRTWQVKGVHNLALEPILGIHSSTDPSGSALSPYMNPQQPQQFKQHIVDPKLNLNLA